MSAESNAPPASTSQESTSASPPAGYGRLARRIGDWTTKGLLTAMILAGGLAVGRQMTAWYRAEPPAPAPADPNAAWGGLGDANQVHELQFGDQDWTLRRQPLHGGPAEARAGLIQVCRELLGNLSPPTEPATESETALLARFATFQPLAEEVGQWRVYGLPGDFPLIVGVRETAPPPDSAGATVARTGLRVVTWAVAVPSSEQAWIGYVFYPRGRSAPASSVAAELPVAPGGRRTLSMQVRGGAGLAAFRGPGPVASWVDYYDHWFADRGWAAQRAWQAAGSVWRAQYVRHEPPGGRVSLELSATADGQCRGLLVSLPGNED